MMLASSAPTIVPICIIGYISIVYIHESSVTRLLYGGGQGLLTAAERIAAESREAWNMDPTRRRLCENSDTIRKGTYVRTAALATNWYA